MPPTEDPASTTGVTNIVKSTTITTTVTKAPVKSTIGTKKVLSGEPSPSYKRKILDMSKFSVSLYYLLHVV